MFYFCSHIISHILIDSVSADKIDFYEEYRIDVNNYCNFTHFSSGDCSKTYRDCERTNPI